MRKIILIAAMALTSAAAQAGERRTLSTAAPPSDAPATIQTKQFQVQNDAPAPPAKPADMPRYSQPPSETQTPADPARNISDAPHARPSPIDNAPPINAPTAPSTLTPSTAQPERRYDDRGYYDDAGYHPFPRRYTNADRHTERPHGYTNRPYHRTRWSARRIIAEMRRYGIYW